MQRLGIEMGVKRSFVPQSDRLVWYFCSLTMTLPSSFLCLLLVCISGSATAFPEEDLVETLPLWGETLTPNYSGYLNATAGCHPDNGYCKIHYWLSLTDDYENSPTVLWSNGGPGSSSILGFLQELGPYLINATGGLMVNPFAWNRHANLVVFESPVGVGYSYCEKQAKGELCTNTDKYTASASRAAVVEFFAKFPKLRSNEFFITGESYAGVYIPTLAYEILTFNSKQDDASQKVPLVGLAVGDPCTDNQSQNDSMDSIWYSHKYGLLDDDVFHKLWDDCEARVPNSMLLVDAERKNLQNWKERDDCKLAYRKFMMSSSHGLSQGWDQLFIDDYSLFGPVSNEEDNAMASYLNRQDVREALHVTETPIKSWPFPEAGFDYTKEYDACNWQDDIDPEAMSMIDFYRKIAPQLKTVWVYNGDTDPCVSYEGTRAAMKKVGFAEVDGGGYRPWFYNHTSVPMKVISEKAIMYGPDLLPEGTGVQFGGEIVNYEHGLAFLTIHGSGHMVSGRTVGLKRSCLSHSLQVPQFRPQAALQMLERLLNHQILSPLLPSNATLLSMSDNEFEHALENWTIYAKTMPTEPSLPNKDSKVSDH